MAIQTREASRKIKVLMAESGKKRGELAELLGISPQHFSTKLYRGSWTGDELLAIAAACGAELAYKDESRAILVKLH